VTEKPPLAGDLGEKLLVGFTRLETKIDMYETRHAKIEGRVDGIDQRLTVVEQKQTSENSFNAGLASGQKKVLNWVQVVWGIVAGFAAVMFTTVGGALLRHFVP